MDAPQISTLREADTPPPEPRLPKLRITFRNKPNIATSSSAAQPLASSPHDEDGDDDEDDQEDQLIDDDDDQPIPPSGLPEPPTLSPKKRGKYMAPMTVPKERLPDRPDELRPDGSDTAKPKSSRHNANKPGRKKEKARPPEEGRLREKVMQQPGAPNLAPTMLWFEANPSHSKSQDSGQPDEQLGQQIVLGPDPPLSMSMKAAGKRKAGTKKASTAKKETVYKKKMTAPQVVPKKIKVLPPANPEEWDRPRTPPSDYLGTPTPEPETHLAPTQNTREPGREPGLTSDGPPDVESNGAPLEDIPINLDGVPVPVYPLPTKPFPVLPPPKIGSGFAPNLPLDRSGAKVRSWRTAKREIRGIGGGRWFAKGWVGEKESAFASHTESQAELRKVMGQGVMIGDGSTSGHVALPKLVMSISAPGTGRGKGTKGKGNAQNQGSSLSTSAAPSRSESQAPDAGGSGRTSGPTKMRSMLQMSMPMAPSSEAGDSDMMGPPGS